MENLSNRTVFNTILLQLSTILVFLEMSLAENIPANFVFGDSLVDVGNNNYIASLSKANYVPNGIDFGNPTGRYTNGRTIVDIIGQELGLKDFTPPYLAPTTAGDKVLHGVNYASGGGGILNYTGKIFVSTIVFLFAFLNIYPGSKGPSRMSKRIEKSKGSDVIDLFQNHYDIRFYGKATKNPYEYIQEAIKTWIFSQPLGNIQSWKDMVDALVGALIMTMDVDDAYELYERIA
ncbi:GDSL esterase/lipase At1g29660-like [Olea europaea var. sylvestris]|uniref:GDSL esterase/lipase At1g29660-like n=1 Tax=Olea europaea var. sylvestris TaxID=158386 RepID=UPI000C1D5240|nr:GDSL esterase/lipase At1g29660-like [Olea europaea var. sylvestris]